MTKRLYLHIGRHKTGTTQIQMQLSKRQAELADAGILYPTSGRDTGVGYTAEERSAHHAIARALFLPREDAKKRLAELRPAFIAETAKAETVLVSSEGFQNILHTDLLIEFFEGFEIQPICYLREYLSYVASSYAQEIKGSGLTVDLPYFERTFQMNLEDFVSRWSAVGHCHWRLYERSRFRGGSVVNDILDCINIPLAAAEENSDSNLSISGSLLSYKLLLNILGLDRADIGHTIKALAASNPNYCGTIFIPARLQKQLRGANACNQLLEKLVGPPELRDFETGLRMFDPVRFPRDFEEIANAVPNLIELQLHPVYALMKRGGVAMGHLYEHPLVKAIVESQNRMAR